MDETGLVQAGRNDELIDAAETVERALQHGLSPRSRGKGHVRERWHQTL